MPQAGTLILFRDRESLHCVTLAHGRRSRLIAVLSYGETPGLLRMSAHTQRLFHGRVA